MSRTNRKLLSYAEKQLIKQISSLPSFRWMRVYSSPRISGSGVKIEIHVRVFARNIRAKPHTKLIFALRALSIHLENIELRLKNLATIERAWNDRRMPHKKYPNR